jgi:hypothetical protein
MRFHKPLFAILAGIGVLALTGAARGEDADAAAPAAVSVQTSTPAAEKPLFSRWLDLKTLSHDERYRNIYNSGGFHLFENGQQRSLVEGRIKLDADARYTIGFRASSGRYYNWAYADDAGAGLTQRVKDPAIINSFTPAEQYELYLAGIADLSSVGLFSSIHSNGWQFYMRELFFSATPVKGVTVEFGSFGVERGLSTEITTFDYDGYLSGERVRIHNPQHLFFDEVGYTNAFFGDIETPNLFDRGSSFKHSNYHQLFAKKQLNQRIGFSADYTRQVGTDTLREAAVIGTKELKVVDGVRFEAYERVKTVNLQGLDIKGASGFAIAVEKKVGTRLSGDFGFASIDKDYAVYYGSRYVHAAGFSLNGDTYSQGKRPFIHASYKINPVVSAFGFYTHAVGEKVYNLNQQGLNAGLSFNLKALANTERRVF